MRGRFAPALLDHARRSRTSWRILATSSAHSRRDNQQLKTRQGTGSSSADSAGASRCNEAEISNYRGRDQTARRARRPGADPVRRHRRCDYQEQQWLGRPQFLQVAWGGVLCSGRVIVVLAAGRGTNSRRASAVRALSCSPRTHPADFAFLRCQTSWASPGRFAKLRRSLTADHVRGPPRQRYRLLDTCSAAALPALRQRGARRRAGRQAIDGGCR